MPDMIGRIEVPEVPVTGAFPLRTDFAHSRQQSRAFVAHQFADGAEQRFYVGDPAPRYSFVRRTLGVGNRALLAAFWESVQGCVGAFSYDVPQDDQSFITKTVRFEDAPLNIEDLVGAISSVGITFVEIPDPEAAPEYTSAPGGPLARFPDAGLADALLDDVQEIIPLVRVRVAEAAVPDIFLSDRRVTVDGQLYLPRLLRIGESGSDVLMSQTIDGSTDDVQFAFGNADRVMLALANDTELKWARIEFSLYHVQTGRMLNLWAGRIVDWSADKGPEFRVSASDVLSALTLSSPVGSCSHSCWRRYAQDGCPATLGVQALDAAHFPEADASTCDQGFETANGCLAHSGGANPTKYSYGAVAAKPQQVKILDNSTGTWGFGRKSITPTSQISDTLWNQPLPEIWHNDDGIPQRGLPVACVIASGREESDFYIALGVVGRGPLGAYAAATMIDTDSDGTRETFIGSTLDGQPHHGWKVDDDGNPTGDSLGLRQDLGTDPAGVNDFFSLGRVGTTPASWREVVGGGSCYEDTYAAGVAFCEIRRVDEKGIQLSTPQSHAMTAIISQGLTGRTWTAPGAANAVDVPGLTNPFWVAINTYLRALGLASEDAAAQEETFDAPAAIACGAEADALVPPIFGATAEKRFRFKGVVDARKPTRDWLRDVLNNGLGYFTWRFGKLRLGSRTSAAPASWFVQGNMLLGSLRLEPNKPQFEKLTVEFADEEYLFAKNTVDYTDQDHAARNGRIQNPLTSQFGLAGCSTKSQAARIAVVRTREELGGITAAEQRAARLASWKSTILALDTEAGMVVGLIDPDVPAGFGAFRIQGWRLNRDWSVDLSGKTVTASMYNLTAGTLPAAVSEAIQPRPAVLTGQLGPQTFTVNGA